MARPDQTYVQTIDRLERLYNSYMGNPRYLVIFTDGTSATTKSNSSVGHSISNKENIGVAVTIRATAAGHIFDVGPVI